jgi:hypothetical protein
MSLTISLVCAQPVALRAQDTSERAGILSGYVVDSATERPIVGALVEVVGTESSARTSMRSSGTIGRERPSRRSRSASSPASG